MRDNSLGRDAPPCVPFEENFSFSAHTTYGCGGVAKRAFFPRNVREARLIFNFLNSSGERFFVLGCGSDVLAQDGRYEGSIICTSRLKGITFHAMKGEYVLNVLSGTTVQELLHFCRTYGFSGLEFLAGIPASIGGLTCMNGGAFGSFIGDRVHSVRLCGLKKAVLSHDECNFAYKQSTMRGIKCLITQTNLQVSRENPALVAKNIKSILAKRANQPGGRSCGCVFENYCGVSAGEIIENAGLKGVSVGKAYVSEEHANFIINKGNSSADVYALIALVKNEVYKKFGVTLKEEVCYIGDF